MSKIRTNWIWIYNLKSINKRYFIVSKWPISWTSTFTIWRFLKAKTFTIDSNPSIYNCQFKCTIIFLLKLQNYRNLNTENNQFIQINHLEWLNFDLNGSSNFEWPNLFPVGTQKMSTHKSFNVKDSYDLDFDIFLQPFRSEPTALSSLSISYAA